MSDFTTTAAAWLRQSTTGQGIATLLGVGTAALSGSIPTSVAVPAAIAGLFLVIFPQKAAAGPAVTTMVTDGEALVKSFKDGIAHGQSVTTAALASVPTALPLLGDVTNLVSALHANTAATAASTGATVANTAVTAAVTAATPPAPVAVVGDPAAPAKT